MVSGGSRAPRPYRARETGTRRLIDALLTSGADDSGASAASAASELERFGDWPENRGAEILDAPAETEKAATAPAGDGSVSTGVRSASGGGLPRPRSSGSTRQFPCLPTTIEPDVRLQLTSEFPCSLPTVQRVLPVRVAAVGGDETDHHAGSDHQPVRVGVVHTPRTTAMAKPFPLAIGRDSRVDRAGSSGEGYPTGVGDVTRERERGQRVNSDGSRGPPRGVDRDEAARRAAMRKGLTVRAVLRL